MGKALKLFSQNIVNCYSIFINGFFYDFFSKIVFVDFFEESIVVFITKHYQLLQRFFSWVFFPSKIIFVDLFLILSWQRIQLCNFFCFLLTEKLNYVAKALYLSSQNTVNCYKSFYSVSEFFITNTTFFFIMKYWLHHTFSFYYLSSVGSQL